MSNSELGPIERFYLRLIDLGGAGSVERTLDSALALLVEITTARLAYVELWDHEKSPRFWRGQDARGSPLEAIRRGISRALVEQVVAEGREVEAGHSGCAALCVPLGRPSCGVLYLETAAGFSDHDRVRFESLAAQLIRSPILEIGGSTGTLTLAEQRQLTDERAVRGAMERHRQNVSAAARELRVTRAFVSKVIARGSKEPRAVHTGTHVGVQTPNTLPNIESTK